MAPGAALQPTASPWGGGDAERRATELTLPHSPKATSGKGHCGGWGDPGESVVPRATHLGARPWEPAPAGRGAATWPGLRGQGSGVGERAPPPPRPGARVPHSAAARGVNTRRPPPPLRRGRRAPADPHCCASGHARKERRGRKRGRRGSAPPRGPAAASARVRGGEGSPGAPPPRRLPPAPRAPRPLTCRGRSEDSHHRHLLDRGLREGGLADVQPRQRAGHVVVGGHYPHCKHVRRRRRRLFTSDLEAAAAVAAAPSAAASPRLRRGPSPLTPTPGAAAGGAGSALLPPPPQEHPVRGDRRRALALPSVLVLVLPPPPGITRAPRSQAAALVAMMMMSRTQPLGEGRRAGLE